MSMAPVALSVGAIVCIAAANAGNTSQDLKTGYIVGATPIYQQIGPARSASSPRRSSSA